MGRKPKQKIESEIQAVKKTKLEKRIEQVSFIIENLEKTNKIEIVSGKSKYLFNKKKTTWADEQNKFSYSNIELAKFILKELNQTTTNCYWKII